MYRPTNNLFIISSAIGYPVDAEPNRIGSSPRLPGMEREMRRQGTAFLLVAKCLPTHHKVIYIQQLAREHVLWGFITILFSFPFKNGTTENCPERFSVFTLAWSAPTTTRGSSTQLVMDSPTRKAKPGQHTISSNSRPYPSVDMDHNFFFSFLIFLETLRPLSLSLVSTLLCCDSLFTAFFLLNNPRHFILKILHIETS